MGRLDPLVRRRHVGHQLRRYREAAGKYQSDVMGAMDWSKSKINRVENGVVAVTTVDLLHLLRYYGVDDEESTRHLLEAARESRRHSNWSEFRDYVSPEYYSFVAHEASARMIRSFQPLVVPGLLQTDEYASAVVGSYNRRTADVVKKRVELRTRRQVVLERDERPALCFLLSEAVISFRVGDARVMRGQLRRLIEVAERPGVTVRIVPFSYGIYPHWREPYVLLEIEEPANGDDAGDLVLYLETPRGELLTSVASGDETGSGRRPSPCPTDWLDDHVTLEAEAGDLELTLGKLHEALARVSA
ncbi:helix-turn-helix transcriptional regulator [Cryptosporangium japonicum]|uniref:Helix-turn-helix transcriptional regulator n=1 Tax=Cryptosporangium japonicum TaxID=80872 RepID=A0ABN0TMH8_9ACTN